MANIVTPVAENIEKYKFYDVSELGWFFENTNEAIENNRAIQENIVKDFSDETGIEYETVMETFAVDYIYTRSTETILLLYKNKDSKDVLYAFVAPNMTIYRELNF